MKGLKIEITGENIIPPLLQDMTYRKTEIVAREKALPRDDTPRPPKVKASNTRSWSSGWKEANATTLKEH